MEHQEEQIELENRMFEIGLSDFEARHDKAKEKSYGTSSPKVMHLVFDAVNQFANQIKYQNEVINAKDDYRNIPSKVLKRVCDDYCRLNQDRPWCNIPQPDLGYLIIATTVWKSVCDRAMSSDDKVSRISLKTEVGNLLRLQFTILHYQDQETEWFKDPATTDLALHLVKLRKELADNDASLSQRCRRASGLYNEVKSGLVEIRGRGRQTNPVKLYYPEESRPTEWQDGYKEAIGTVLLDLLCVPKNEDVRDDDPRPFLYIADKNNGDTIKTRQCFEAALTGLTDHFSRFLFAAMPMLAEPLNWDLLDDKDGSKITGGGYYTLKLRKLNPLVRFNSTAKCETKPSQLMVDLVNKVQQTHWQLDQDQVAMVRHISRTWETDFDGIMRPMPYTVDDLKKGESAHVKVIPEVVFRDQNKERVIAIKENIKTGGIATSEEQELLKEFNNAMWKLSELYRNVEKAKQRHVAFLDIDRRFRETSTTFYYPWNFDYRTRLYPIPGVAQPQGAAVERYSLEFVKGQHLSLEGEGAALRAIGAAAIDTKTSIKSRIDWSLEHLDLIRFIGTGTDAAIAEAGAYEEPLQLIQLCRAWTKHENGETWNTPIYADATNSGWQIVSALINSVNGLTATNVCAATPDEQPRDAYKQTQWQVAQWLLDKDHRIQVGGKPATASDRRLLLELLIEDGKPSSLGRKLSKAFGRTAIYGSGHLTQCDDLKEILDKVRITEETISKPLRSCLTGLIRKAYVNQLGEVLAYNPALKSMVWERIGQQADSDLISEVKELQQERSKLQSKQRDLPDSKLNKLIELTRKVHDQCTDLTFNVKGSVIDLRNYLITTKEFKTVFHGKPTHIIRHNDAMDLSDTVSAAPPALIHHLDSLILANAYSDAPFELTTVHDSVGCLPNDFDEMCQRYRSGFLAATNGNVLDDIADQWNVKQKVKREDDDSWRLNVLNASYLFN